MAHSQFDLFSFWDLCSSSFFCLSHKHHRNSKLHCRTLSLHHKSYIYTRCCNSDSFPIFFWQPLIVVAWATKVAITGVLLLPCLKFFFRQSGLLLWAHIANVGKTLVVKYFSSSSRNQKANFIICSEASLGPGTIKTDWYFCYSGVIIVKTIFLKGNLSCLFPITLENFSNNILVRFKQHTLKVLQCLPVPHPFS